jgi:hypothetical protein
MKFYSSLQVKSIFVAKAVAWIVANIFYQSDFLSNVFRAFAFVLIFVFCVLDIRKQDDEDEDDMFQDYSCYGSIYTWNDSDIEDFIAFIKEDLFHDSSLRDEDIEYID